MIPYIQITNKNSITCNADLAILDEGSPVLISLCDIHIKNKKVCSDMISESYGITLRDREDSYFSKSLYCRDKYRFKSEKMENNLTHTIIYSNRINEYCINWNNENKTTIITTFLRNKHFLPITEEIIEKMFQTKYSDSIFKNINVYTNNPEYKNLEVYKINIRWFKETLNNLSLEGYDNEFPWDEIECIEDYIFKFLEPIKNKLGQNVKVLFDKNNIDSLMFEGIKKPFEGQVPVIQSALEVLKRNRFVYLAAEQGVGKTLMSIKTNHCHLLSKSNSINNNYVTLILAPAITLTQWEEEIKNSIKDADKDINIYIIKKTVDFIKIYNKTNMKFDKPTYFIIGKETFKLDCHKKSGVNIKTKPVKYKKKEQEYYGWNGYSRTVTKDKKEVMTIAFCPDCGVPLQNLLRKSEDVFFTAKDFVGNPKKSNYKCNNCGSVLWQSCYDKTKKVSLIRFIKTKNIHFDSIIADEIHEQNNAESIIGSSTRTLFNYSKKILLLSGTNNTGYSSSLHNLLLGLLPNKLKANEVLEIENFIKTYGTLMAVSKRKDGEYYRSGRSEIKDSEFKEIEGINPIVFTKYLAENYVFATLDDLGKYLPVLKEEFIPIQQSDVMEINEHKLWNDIKTANAFNSKMYESTILTHYVNNPFNWNTITIQGKGEIDRDVQPINLIDESTIFSKEKILLDIVKKEISEGRKCCIYVGFGGGGEYMQGKTLPDRIESLLKSNGIKTYQLKASVTTYQRKEVLDKQKDKFDVLITNPLLVQVGLNLVYIPTYINYMPSYMVNTVTQSNRRGYRANSILENRIYHLYYENSCENAIIKRFQRKNAESKAITGQFNVVLENDSKIRTASGLGKRINDGIDNEDYKNVI